MLTPEQRIGTLVADKYRLEEVLGVGGIGVVFGGTQAITGRPVALKLLQAKHAASPKVVARFFREARALGALDHPNIVQVLDMCRAGDGEVCLVMERLRGEPLTARLKRGRPSLAEAVRLLCPVLDALEEAHSRGFVHRDIKPDNIFLAQERGGRVVPKLLDFGLVKAFSAQERVALTATGSVMGTPSFMSPEQARGQKEVGPPSDLWSMGVLFYTALTWKHPFPGAVGLEMVRALLTTDPVPIREAEPGLPESVATWIDATLRRDPAARPTAKGLREALLSEALQSEARALEEADVEGAGRRPSGGPSGGGAHEPPRPG